MQAHANFASAVFETLKVMNHVVLFINSLLQNCILSPLFVHLIFFSYTTEKLEEHTGEPLKLQLSFMLCGA